MRVVNTEIQHGSPTLLDLLIVVFRLDSPINSSRLGGESIETNAQYTGDHERRHSIE
jgi:hypothetical protein